jgi:hypothetical protein
MYVAISLALATPYANLVVGLDQELFYPVRECEATQ